MSELELADLNRMGIDIPMHRNKVQYGIESIRAFYSNTPPSSSTPQPTPAQPTIRKIDSGLNNENNNNNTPVHMGDDATNELVFSINVSDSCYNGSNSNSSNSVIIDC